MSNYFFQTIANYTVFAAVCRQAKPTHAFKIASAARLEVLQHTHKKFMLRAMTEKPVVVDSGEATPDVAAAAFKSSKPSALPRERNQHIPLFPQAGSMPSP